MSFASLTLFTRSTGRGDRPPSLRRPGGCRLAVRLSAVCLWVLALASCDGESARRSQSSPEGAPQHGPTSRGYVLISIDTLRADHLGAYGYGRETSPFFDSLARRGVLFERAMAHAPSTLPSHISLFTGLLPGEHGVIGSRDVLAPTIPTLPELFSRHGVRTAGHTEGGYVDGDYGFARGFDEFADAPDRRTQDVRLTFDRGEAFLRSLGAEDRFFLFLHTYSVHDPYVPPRRYRGLFWQDERPDVFRPTGENLVSFNRGRRDLSPAGLAWLRSQYDASIRYVDDALRDLFATLEELGLDDEVTVMVTSDHGEEFLEHGFLTHGQAYPEHLHVPLLVVGPGVEEGRRVDEIVGLADVAPTLLDLAGLPRPETTGRSLRRHLVSLAGDETGTAAGEASAWAFEPPVRALVRQASLQEVPAEDGPVRDGPVRDDDVEAIPWHLVFFRSTASPVPGAPGEVWGGLRFSFDLGAPGRGEVVELEVAAYHHPRALTVERVPAGRPPSAEDTEILRELRLQPGVFVPLVLEATPEEAPLRLLLRADSCDSPRSLRDDERDDRCHAIRVRGPALHRLELYDLAADPLARHDLSGERPEMASRLLRRLLADAPEPRHEVGERELDPELVERLQALGYLQ